MSNLMHLFKVKTMPDIIEEKVKKRNISAKKLMFVDTRKNYLTERRTV